MHNDTWIAIFSFSLCDVKQQTPSMYSVQRTLVLSHWTRQFNSIEIDFWRNVDSTHINFYKSKTHFTQVNLAFSDCRSWDLTAIVYTISCQMFHIGLNKCVYFRSIKCLFSALTMVGYWNFRDASSLRRAKTKNKQNTSHVSISIEKPI